MTIVIFLSPEFNPNYGGVEQSTAKLALFLKNNGNRCLILSSTESQIQNWNNIPIFFIDTTNKSTFRKDLLKIISNFDVKLIINQMGYDLRLTKLLRINAPRNVLVFNTLRMNPLSFVQNSEQIIKEKLLQLNFGFFYSEMLRKLIVFYHKIKQTRNYKALIDISDKFIVLNNSYINELAFFGVHEENTRGKIEVIPNMFEQKENSEPKKNQILFVGRLEKQQKRIDLLMQILKSIHGSINNWEVIVIGDGPMKQELIDFVRNEKLSKVKILGYQQPDFYYQQAKILLFTSAYEGFGNVLVEAQQHGVVPILFDSYSAAKEIVQDGKTGFLIKPFNTELFAKTVLNLVQNEDLWFEFSENAILHSKIFGIDLVGDKWLSLIKSYN